MIRYVLAALITVLIVGMSMPAMNHAAGVNGERQVETAISDVGSAATALVGAERLPPKGETGPRRSVTVQFPGDSMVENPVVTLRIQRVSANLSLVTYRVEGRSKHVARIRAPIVAEGGGAVELGGRGEQRYVLTLERDDDGDPVVVLRSA